MNAPPSFLNGEYHESLSFTKKQSVVSWRRVAQHPLISIVIEPQDDSISFLRSDGAADTTDERFSFELYPITAIPFESAHGFRTGGEIISSLSQHQTFCSLNDALAFSLERGAALGGRLIVFPLSDAEMLVRLPHWSRKRLNGGEGEPPTSRCFIVPVTFLFGDDAWVAVVKKE